TTLTGGGRYDGLVDVLEGPKKPGIGVGMGIEGLIMALEDEGIDIPVNDQVDCSFIAVLKEAYKRTVALVHALRQHGIQVDKNYPKQKIKAQFKAANRLKANYVLILGDSELEKDVIEVKNMQTGDQEEIPLNSVVEQMKRKLLG